MGQNQGKTGFKNSWIVIMKSLKDRMFFLDARDNNHTVEVNRTFIASL